MSLTPKERVQFSTGNARARDADGLFPGLTAAS